MKLMMDSPTNKSWYAYWDWDDDYWSDDEGQGTCNGYCGGQSGTGSCYCDSSCTIYGDCCDDEEEFCSDHDDDHLYDYNYWYQYYYSDPVDVPIEGELVIDEAVTGDTSSAANYYGNPSNDKFYTFTPPSGDAYTFSTCGSNYDTHLRVFTTDGAGAYSVSASNQIESEDDHGSALCTYDAVRAYRTLPLSSPHSLFLTS